MAMAFFYLQKVRLIDWLQDPQDYDMTRQIQLSPRLAQIMGSTSQICWDPSFCAKEHTNQCVQRVMSHQFWSVVYPPKKIVT